MELHNTMEDIVVARVSEIFEAIEKGDAAQKYCTCKQCRMDITCYALNRVWPHYIVSNRGVSRVQWATLERQ
ncbi:MAG: late competence development ComFB family protein, partial [Treponema sp.]|nr:late competence development ComFB family protein [Treponema sp.]